MSAGVARDRVAAKIANLPRLADGRGHVFGNGYAGIAGVSPTPSTLVDQAINVLVVRGPTERSGNTGNQWLSRTIEATFHFPAFDRSEAERIADTIEDEIMDEFSQGITLGGPPYIDCLYMGSDRPVIFTDGEETEWWAMTSRFRVRERFTDEMTP